MSPNLKSVFASIDANIPIFLEENADVIDDIDLQALITKMSNVDDVYAKTVVGVLDSIFSALGLIQYQARQNGKWRFRSYAAWLLARSILSILKTEGQAVFDSGYWSTNCADSVIDEQRQILRFLESSRIRFHPQNKAEPIRFVYVAWGVICLNGQFLLYHREDKSRRDALGNFGLPGGRFCIDDAPHSFHNNEKIRDFALGLTHWPLKYLDKTLVREIDEELGLSSEQHFFYQPLVDLQPYIKVEGSKNNHALTEYRIRLYSIQLNNRGLVHLFDEITKNPTNFSWFTENELLQGSNSKGERAFIDAIVEHKKIQIVLNLQFESFSNVLRTSYPTGSGITIPITHNKSILSGKTKSDSQLKKIDANLTDYEHSWLLALTAHAKALPIESIKHVLLPYGWVKLSEIDREAVSALKEKLDKHKLDLIEILDESYARLSAPPSAIYFDNESFSYAFNYADKSINLRLTSFHTAIGEVKEQQRRGKLSPDVNNAFKIAADAEKNDFLPTDSVKRAVNDNLGDILKELGLRILLDNKFWKFKVKSHLD